MTVGGIGCSGNRVLCTGDRPGREFEPLLIAS